MSSMKKPSFPMRKPSWLVALSVSLFIVTLSAGQQACRQPPVVAESKPQPEFKPVASIKELMASVIDTNADVVWNAVSSVSTPTGMVENEPKTPEEWQIVRNGAIALIEAGNLLQMERRTAPPGHTSEAPGVELEPEAMDKLIAEERAAWNFMAQALTDSGMDFLKAIDAKDVAAMLPAGERLDQVCESCHLTFWYPGQVIPEIPRTQ